MQRWKFFGRSKDELQNFQIGGLNVWQKKWKPRGEKIEVADPDTGDLKLFAVYEIQDVKRVHTFAAGELSDGTWGFFLPG